MSFCTQCGNAINEGETACSKCGAPAEPIINHPTNHIPTTHDVPRCTCCGHIGPWKVSPLFSAIDIIIAIVLLCLGFVPGLIYIVVHIILFGSKNNRAKRCTKCNAKNLFTFLY